MSCNGENELSDKNAGEKEVEAKVGPGGGKRRGREWEVSRLRRKGRFD